VDARLVSPRFPRASAYHPDWLLGAISGAANPLWMTEWLTEALPLTPGMRVLDLGCGRALSSIFLHREFGVEVWATDLWFSAAENLQRIRDAGAGAGVFPIHADARTLPFAPGFFDAIVSIDSYFYYGTDDLYLGYLARFVKPGGLIGMAGAGVMSELEPPIPAYLQHWWQTDQPWCLHSADWWRRHWARTGIVDVEVADAMPDGWRFWRDWLALAAPGNTGELAVLDADAGRYMGYVRAIGRRRADAPLVEPVPPIPSQYQQLPMRRHD
jgi:SAM-dependent methyltransferase